MKTKMTNYLTKLIVFLFLFTQALSVFATEVQIFSNETLETNANTHILDFDDTGGDVTLQFGNTLNEQLYWDNTKLAFIFTDDLGIQGNLDVTGTFTFDGAGVAISSILDEDNMASDSATALSTQQSIKAYVDTQVSSAGHTQNTDTGTTQNSFIINSDADDATLQFGQTAGGYLVYANATDLFTINGNTNITGNVDINGTITAGSNNIQITNATGYIDGNNVSIDSSGITNSSSTNTQGVLNDLDSAISTNTSSVSTNTANISFNTTGINTNATNISANTSSINTNATNISSNDTDIASNTSNINTNTSNITTNATNISANTSSINTNASNISTNTANISSANTAITSHTDGGANKHDASEIDIETAGNITTVSDLETNLGAIDTAIGNRNYTNNNVVTDGETITSSIDKLDQAITGTTGNKTKFITINDLTIQKDSSNNSANIYADSETGVNPHQYYILKTKQTDLQDLEYKFKVKLPDNFKDFSNTNDISFFYKNTGIDNTDSKIDILVEDEDGDDAFTATDGQGLFNTSWTEYIDEFDGGSFDPVAGEYIYITVKAYGSYDNGFQSPYTGEIVLQYTTEGI